MPVSTIATTTSRLPVDTPHASRARMSAPARPPVCPVLFNAHCRPNSMSFGAFPGSTANSTRQFGSTDSTSGSRPKASTLTPRSAPAGSRKVAHPSSSDRPPPTAAGRPPRPRDPNHRNRPSPNRAARSAGRRRASSRIRTITSPAAASADPPSSTGTATNTFGARPGSRTNSPARVETHPGNATAKASTAARHPPALPAGRAHPRPRPETNPGADGGRKAIGSVITPQYGTAGSSRHGQRSPGLPGPPRRRFRHKKNLTISPMRQS